MDNANARNKKLHRKLLLHRIHSLRNLVFNAENPDAENPERHRPILESEKQEEG
jgi:hypothetical protein